MPKPFLLPFWNFVIIADTFVLRLVCSFSPREDHSVHDFIISWEQKKIQSSVQSAWSFWNRCLGSTDIKIRYVGANWIPKKFHFYIGPNLLPLWSLQQSRLSIHFLSKYQVPATCKALFSGFGYSKECNKVLTFMDVLYIVVIGIYQIQRNLQDWPWSFIMLNWHVIHS